MFLKKAWPGLVLCSLSSPAAYASLGLAQQTITCNLASHTGDEAIKRFQSQGQIFMGDKPRTMKLVDEKQRQKGRFKTNVNPHPLDANSYLRAASGVGFVENLFGSQDSQVSVIIAQDSRRYLGFGSFAIEYDKATEQKDIFAQSIPSISVIASAPRSELMKYANDWRDYDSYRERYKRDHEALTTLPDGSMLILSSGSDIQRHMKGGLSFRADALIFDPEEPEVKRFHIPEFFATLHTNPKIIGTKIGKKSPRINIEGVTVRPDGQRYIISFFHRANYGKNSHNAMIDFDLANWLETLKASRSNRDIWSKLRPLRVTHIRLPMVKISGGKKKFAINLNDALFGYHQDQPTLIIPVGTEADYVDKDNVHHDGTVIFAGLAIWQGIDTDAPSCQIYQAPGDPKPGQPSLFGKVEGLAAYNPTGTNRFERSLYQEGALLVGVTDADSELEPSLMRVLTISP